jgi:hypothetical protein
MSQRRPPIVDLIGPELANLPRRQKRQRLTQKDEMYILWARSQGLSFRTIAARLNATTNTIHRHYQELISEPELIFELPVLRQTGPKTYECVFCGASRQGRVRSMRHVLAHFLPPEIAAGADLTGIPAAL